MWTQEGFGHNVSEIHASKRMLRQDILAVRFRLTADDASARAAFLAERAQELPEVAAADTVAAYVSVGREPGTRPLLDALRARGVRVLLPVLLPDNDLDWGAYEGPGSLVRAGRGLLEPGGSRFGPEAVTKADVVLLPGLAVDGQGMRLGRGGGSYDRVLERLDAHAAPGAEGARGREGGPLLTVLLYDDEIIGHVPAEPHDRAVHAAVTPSGVRRFDG
ncbi:5-formyltetrahydrofolate cyclo-ligase [Streptomyces daliensis]